MRLYFRDRWKPSKCRCPYPSEGKHNIVNEENSLGVHENTEKRPVTSASIWIARHMNVSHGNVTHHTLVRMEK